MPQTLADRVASGIHHGHLALNNDPYEVRLQCAYCDEDLLIDYFQIGISAMNREITSFVARHTNCKIEAGLDILVACAMHDDDVRCPLCRDDGG